MWLSRLHLQRFGAFQDWPLDGLQPGLNVLYGPNEAGKTTLLAFLRAMLFGFKKNHYDPLDGSEPGGNLRLVDPQGRSWGLERRGRGRKVRIVVSAPGGVAHGEEKLRALVHHLSEQVYQNIFAFGLKELQELETLKQREVKHLLYSASMGLQGISLRQVEDALDKETGSLLKPRASTPEINRILVQLGELRKNIREWENQPEEYHGLQLSRQELEVHISQAAHEKDGAARNIARLTTLRQAWDVWQEFRQLQAELAELPPVEDFPADGLRRWEDLKKELSGVNEQLEQFAGALGDMRQAPPEPINAALLEVADAIRDLWDDRKLFQQKTEELQGLAADQAAAQSRLDQSLAILGPPWDEARLEAFNPPLAWKSALPQWPQRQEAAATAVREAEERCRRLRESLQEKEAARDQARNSGPWSQGGGIFLGSFAALGVILALAAAGAYYLDTLNIAGLLAVGAGMAWLAALVHVLQMRATHRRRLRDLEADTDQARSAHEMAAAAADQARQLREDMHAEWRGFLQQWSFDPEVSPFAVMETLREAGKARDLLHARREAERAVEALQAYLEGITGRLHRIQEHLGHPPAVTGEVSRTLEGLHAELTAALKLHESRQQWEKDLINLEKQWALWNGKSQRLQADLEHLLAAAGMEDEEAFRHRAALYQRRQEVGQKSGQLVTQLQLLAGGPEAWDTMQGDLGQTTLHDLEEQLRRAQTQWQELESQLGEARQQQGIIMERLAKLERAEDLSQALLKEQELAAQLAAAAHRWTVATLARHFLDQGRRRFEAESQPQVLQRASNYFELLTAGRYRQVMATLEGENFLVINRQGHHVPVDHLSRGTAEQLYLALRFALVQEYSQGERKLPLILDDILVNFDHRRARQAVLLLQEMSLNHQLLLFTCHPHILTLVAETLGPTAPAPIMLEGNI